MNKQKFFDTCVNHLLTQNKRCTSKSMEELQYIHDSIYIPIETWEKELSAFAKEYKLNFNPPIKSINKGK